MNYKIHKKIQDIFSSYLERNKMRKTPERFAVIKEIYSMEGHFDVEFLYIQMKKRKYNVSRATIYNTLVLLLACHLVIKHQFGDSVAQYEKSFGYTQHDHLICTDCHKVAEFCDPRIQNIQHTVEKLMHVNVKSHSLILYASCNKEHCENRK